MLTVVLLSTRGWATGGAVSGATATTTAGIRVQRYGEPSVAVEAMGLTIVPGTAVVPRPGSDGRLKPGVGEWPSCGTIPWLAS